MANLCLVAAGGSNGTMRIIFSLESAHPRPNYYWSLPMESLNHYSWLKGLRAVQNFGRIFGCQKEIKYFSIYCTDVLREVIKKKTVMNRSG